MNRADLAAIVKSQKTPAKIEAAIRAALDAPSLAAAPKTVDGTMTVNAAVAALMEEAVDLKEDK